MNKSNNPLRLNVGYMYHKPIGTSREVPVELSSIEIDDLLINQLMSVVKISRTREGLLLQITADAKIETICVRCLEGVILPVSVEFEELYQFPSRHREETDLILPDDGYIDLSSLYREYLILVQPIKGLCKGDCLGLCVICGVNLNKVACSHHVEGLSQNDMIQSEEFP